jgi:hypothetical protein
MSDMATGTETGEDRRPGPRRDPNPGRLGDRGDAGPGEARKPGPHRSPETGEARPETGKADSGKARRDAETGETPKTGKARRPANRRGRRDPNRRGRTARRDRRGSEARTARQGGRRNRRGRRPARLGDAEARTRGRLGDAETIKTPNPETASGCKHAGKRDARTRGETGKPARIRPLRRLRSVTYSRNALSARIVTDCVSG